MEELCKILLTGGAGAWNVFLTPVALAAVLPVLLVALGFTSGGIAASTIASIIYYASTFGGGMTFGSLVETLLSLGAGAVFTSGAGGVAGWLISSICNTTETN
ncbi:interferon alpha-inducible protein 27-like protein 2A [Thunnus thynnus]|uniref:interferon alpha-inducible protein 27-like protein 2A n=1 Tax=Thunnus thynnus TaxID=8237 RepID=UPI0035276719